MALTSEEFTFISRLVYSRAAIVLTENKGYLVEARLQQVIRNESLGSISELVNKLNKPGARTLEEKVIDAMTTNETSFFRDTKPFIELRERVLPDLIKKRAAEKTLTLWCAASSSGQEPYSIAMVLNEHFPQLKSWRLRFIASDISPSVLDAAKRGTYNQLEVNRGLPPVLLKKYFSEKNSEWTVCDKLRNTIEFRIVNLIEPFNAIPAVDILFIRNVLIYFDIETKQHIFGKIAQTLRPDGYLFLGTAESTLGASDSFQRVNAARCSLYQPNQNN